MRYGKLCCVALALLPVLWLGGWRVDGPPANVSARAWEATEDGARTEVLVLLAEQADVRPAGQLANRLERGRWIHARLWATAQRTQAPLRAWLDARGVPHRSFYLVNMVQLQADRVLLAALAARPEVARVLHNPWVPADLPTRASPDAMLPAAPQSVPWGVARVGAPEVWDLGFTGQGIVVAGQDTGYEWDHPALQAQYRGWNGASASHDYHWHDAIHSGGGACGPDSPEPCDDYWHGTHTMGTIVGDDGAANQVGVAPGVRWIGCRNMNQGYGSPASYTECFEFFLAPYPVAGDPAQGDPALAPDVINNSWGCPPSEGCDAAHIDLLRQVVETVRAAGIMVVSSAGNSGVSGCGSVNEPPGMFDATYAIGATQSDANDTVASFSSRGAAGLLKPDLAAPGVGVRSTLLNGTYGNSSGTSMASPHVVGAVALLWSARPHLRGQITATEAALNAAAVPRYSTQCGDPANTVPNQVYGWGRLDVLAAVQAVPVSGTLAGTVVEAGCAPLAGAAITVTRSSTESWGTLSGVGGAYRLPLPAGTYTVTATLAGYEGALTGGVTVSSSLTTTLPITLVRACVPVAGVAFTATPSAPLPGETVVFSASVRAGDPPITYTWNFGDGAPLRNGNPVTHTFPSVTALTPYSVAVVAHNACGTDVASAWVSVSPHRLYLPWVVRR